MKVRVNIEDTSFDLACAEGEQTIKWLSLAAVHVYKRRHFAKGRIRQREPICKLGGLFIPANVINDETGEKLDSKSEVRYELSDGSSVTVELQKEIKIGRRGIPEPTKFSCDAFSSNVNVKLRLAERLESEQIKQQELAEEELRRKQEASQRIFGSVDSETARAFSNEFDELISKNFIREIEIEDVKETIARYFEELDTLFKHFSGFCAGETNSISFAEFGHCVHKTGMFDITKDSNIIRKIFHTAGITLNEDQYPDGAFPRGSFIEAIARIAIYKWPDISAADAVDNLMHDCILPYLDVCKVTEIQQTLESAEIQAIAHDSFAKLHRIFRRYCRADYVHGKSKINEIGTMNLAEFKMVLRDAELIPVAEGSRSRKNQLSIEEEGYARTAFARSQHSGDSVAEDNDLEEMTYPEYVEGLLWFAILKKSAENDYMDYKHMSLSKRVESFHWVVSALVQLQGIHDKKDSLKKMSK